MLQINNVNVHALFATKCEARSEPLLNTACMAVGLLDMFIAVEDALISYLWPLGTNY